MVRAGEPNRVRIDPMLGSRVQGRQTWARVYIADRQPGTDNDRERGCKDYEEPAHHFSWRTLTTEKLTSQRCRRNRTPQQRRLVIGHTRKLKEVSPHHSLSRSSGGQRNLVEKLLVVVIG